MCFGSKFVCDAEISDKFVFWGQYLPLPLSKIGDPCI
jgi:hypothetical protein